jgi:hypothetical protein
MGVTFLEGVVSTSGKAGAQIPHPPLADDSFPWGEIIHYVFNLTRFIRLGVTSHSQPLINTKFENLKVIRRLLNTNSMSAASYEGGGRHGHLGIIMTNEEYFAIAIEVFPMPANPGPSDAVVAGMTASVIAETTRLHRDATQVYRTYHNVDQAIKKLIIESFGDAYLNALSDEIVGYANCTSLQRLTHLLTYYSMISPTELTQNYERLNTPYDPSQPIEMLFQQIQDARAFAVAGASLTERL